MAKGKNNRVSAKKKNDREYNAAGVLFVGCVLLGAGLGMWTGHSLAGLLSGVGVGFICMALATTSSPRTKRPQK